MVKKISISQEIKKIALKFGKIINNQGFPISKIIIFGSYSKKTFGKESDIDICLVSPKFGKDPVSELQFLLKQSRRIDDRIEPIPISAKDYQNSSTPLIFEIKKYGITV